MKASSAINFVLLALFQKRTHEMIRLERNVTGKQKSLQENPVSKYSVPEKQIAFWERGGTVARVTDFSQKEKSEQAKLVPTRWCG